MGQRTGQHEKPGHGEASLVPWVPCLAGFGVLEVRGLG